MLKVINFTASVTKHIIYGLQESSEVRPVLKLIGIEILFNLLVHQLF